MRQKPLSGIRVLDLTRLLPGPVCTLHLADLGADVIKVEDTGAGDYARTLGVGAGRLAPVFLAINRNKRSVCVDLKNPEGQAVFRRLLATAQVLVEGFRPGVMERLGFGYDECRAQNPALVYCSISGYGQDGPYRSRAGHDVNYIGYAGVLDQIGPAGGDPAIPNLQIADILGGAVVPAMSILAALIDAQRSGEGRRVDVAMTEAVFAHNYQALSATALQGRPVARGEDLLSGREPCYSVYRTADGRHMAVGALEKKFFARVCELLERPDLMECHWEDRRRDAAWGKSEMAKLFSTRTQREWIALFDAEDCCVTPVLAFDEAISDAHMLSRAMLFASRHPLAGEAMQFSTPFKMSDLEVNADLPAPSQGEHTDALLSELGYSAPEIAALRAAKAV
jgi:alpha-methylacyl-CoA racemase